jgi:tetratricopeptide (TPR) repeat protein
MFVYLQDNQFQKGLADAQVLLKDYPKNIISWFHLGRFQLSLGQTAQAIQTFDQILKEDPKITVTLFFKGRALMFQGKNQEAQTVLEQFVQVHPNPEWQAYGYYQLGQLALKRGDTKAALAYFRNVFKVTLGTY